VSVDLPVFLNARLDAAETRANALFFACRNPDWTPDFTGCGGAAAEDFWRLFTPARVLREVTAERAILAAHATTIYYDPVGRREYMCETCHVPRDRPGYGWCQTLRILAAVYSDHPDYQAEWKP
jgi:hypothetical protein